MGVAVFGGYAYQGPPFRLGYYGLGEPICFVTWCMGVVAAYHSQFRHDRTFKSGVMMLQGEHGDVRASFMMLWEQLSHPQSSTLLVAALLVAIPTTIILLCSHFHQIWDDQAAGKRSPVVRLGTKRAANVVCVSLFVMYALQIGAWMMDMLPPAPAVLALLSIPKAYALATFIQTFHAQPERNRVAKYFAVRLHFHHGVALATGYALTRLLTNQSA
jgi:1,4-dihydroxy-2-naphthoate octaprenyltransferase